MDNNVNGYQPITREDNCFSEGLPSKFNPFKPCGSAKYLRKYVITYLPAWSYL